MYGIKYSNLIQIIYTQLFGLKQLFPFNNNYLLAKLYGFFDIVAGVQPGDTLAPYLFIICLDYVVRTLIDLMKENSFTLKKARSRRYPAKTIMDPDYTYDIALLANTPTQAESRRHSLEQVALTCISMQTKRSTCVLIKKETSPH